MAHMFSTRLSWWVTMRSRREPGIWEVFWGLRRPAAAGLAAFVVSTLLIYAAEHRAQPDEFATIFDAAWWSVVTLSTVGYGDLTPITPLGQLVAAATAVFGLFLLILIAFTAFTIGMRQEAWDENRKLQSSGDSHTAVVHLFDRKRRL